MTKKHILLIFCCSYLLTGCETIPKNKYSCSYTDCGYFSPDELAEKEAQELAPYKNLSKEQIDGALFDAVKNDDWKTIQFLLEAVGADPNKRLDNGNTYLHYIIENTQERNVYPVFSAFLSPDLATNSKRIRVKINLKNNNGLTALDLANYKYLKSNKSGYKRIVDLLRQVEADETGWADKKHAQEVEIARKQEEERARKAREQARAEEARREREFRENNICLSYSGGGVAKKVYISGSTGVQFDTCTRKESTGRYRYEIQFATGGGMFEWGSREEKWTCSGSFTVNNPDTHRVRIGFSGNSINKSCEVYNVYEEY